MLDLFSVCSLFLHSPPHNPNSQLQIPNAETKDLLWSARADWNFLFVMLRIKKSQTVCSLQAGESPVEMGWTGGRECDEGMNKREKLWNPIVVTHSNGKRIAELQRRTGAALRTSCSRPRLDSSLAEKPSSVKCSISKGRSCCSLEWFFKI